MRTVIRYLPLLAIPACQPSQDELEEQTFDSLVQAERTFAGTAASAGTRTAFLEFLAADGVVFDAGPVNGRSVWEQRPEGGAILSWAPAIADVSAAGDMGYTSGPWEVRATPEAESVGWGHFVSVWKKDVDGNWKVAADGGISHGPVPLNENGTVVRVGGGAGASSSRHEVDVSAAGLQLAEIDAEYSRSVAEGGFDGSIVQYLSESARFYRNGDLPLLGREAAVASALVTGAGWAEWEASDAVVSQSGDMGFTYGVVASTPEDSESGSPWNASYYRIWKQDAESRWRVVVDVLIPFAPSGE